MNYTRMKIMSAVFLALIATGTGAVCAADGRGEAPTPPDAAGRVKAISADGKILTLESGGGRGVEPTKTEVKLNDKTKVEFTGALKDVARKLKVGDSVSAWLNNGTAERIHISAAPDLAGTITAVSADGKVVTVETQTPGGRGEEPKKSEIKIKVTDTTKLAESRDPNEDIKPQVGNHVAIWLEEGSKDTAAALQSRKPGTGGRRP
jgi:hypothetical protein